MKSVCASDRVSSACFFLLLSVRHGKGASFPRLYLRYHFSKESAITLLRAMVKHYVPYSKYLFLSVISGFLSLL